MAVFEEECSSTARSQTSSSTTSSPSSSSNTKKNYYLAKSTLRSSAVLQVVQGHLRSPLSNDIVFGKETSIELVVTGEDGVVQSMCEQPVFGIIKDIAVLRWNEKFHARCGEMRGKDLLVVLSDSGKLSVLSFCNEMHRFFPVTHVQLSIPGNTSNQLGRRLIVDSSGCFIAVRAFEDRIGLFSVSVSAGTEVIDKFQKIFYPENEREDSTFKSFQKPSISGTIWSMCFITKGPRQQSNENNPVLAVLTNRREADFLSELFLLEWDIRDQTVCILGKYIDANQLAVDVVEVPNLYGFAFLFRIGNVCLLDLRDPSNPYCVNKTSLAYLPTAIEEHIIIDEPCKENYDDERLFNVAASALLKLRDYEPMSIDYDSCDMNGAYKRVCSWTWEPDSDKIPRVIICLDTGEFYMIDISVDSAGLKVKLADCLYKGLACNVLLWTEGGYLAAFVEMGDGMVLKFDNGRLHYSSSIQSIAPILDMSVVDYHDEKHEQIYACCGVAPNGSLRVIRSGVSVEKLLCTAPTYQGISNIWTVKMRLHDSYHSFLVLSFVEETRVLSVGLSFTDVTDSVGFRPDVCTLACGLLYDGLLVQIHQKAVRLCLPTEVAHSDGIPLTTPVCISWIPENMNISLGAVGNNMIIVSTSNPCFLYVLGVRLTSSYSYEIHELQHLRLQNELSCISIPQNYTEQKHFCSSFKLFDNSCGLPLPSGVNIGNTFVVGTHRPSVEVLSFVPDKGLRIAAFGTITLTNTVGTAISGCVPQDVRLVLADRLYVLAGLRNGMLLRFEWPLTSKFFSSEPNVGPSGLAYTGGNLPNRSSLRFRDVNMSDRTKDDCPINLQLIAVRRIGITPVFLVPLNDSLDTDIIALSDRPWLLHTARHSLTYTSISFQPSTHVTPVCTAECPTGILFVSENSLNLVEIFRSKRLNVQKFNLEGTPRKVLYHNESKLLLIMRTELNDDTYSSDICCVDPLSGSVVSSFKFEYGEIGKSMALVKVGNEQVLVVGTSQSSGPVVMPSGEAESTKGRLIVLCLEHAQHSDNGSMTFCSKAGSLSHRSSPFREIVGYAVEQLSSSSLCSSPDDASFDGFKLEETEAWHFRLTYATPWPGIVLAVCPYLDRYFLASASNAFYVCGFPNDIPQRVRRFAVARTRFMITTLTTHFTRIAVGDCRDGIIFFSYQEDNKKLEQLDSDPFQRLVAECTLINVDTAVVSDRKGSIAVLSSLDRSQENASPEHNLTLDCAYYMGEVAMSIRKGKFTNKLPSDDATKDGGCTANFELSDSAIIASTLLGSIIIIIPLSREEYDLLDALQARLVVHPLTAPILGNDHYEFRNREIPVGAPKILDGDILAQFLELTSIQQEAVLSLPLGSSNSIKSSSIQPISVNQVVQLLERIHYALN